jgi:hypothetical protein
VGVVSTTCISGLSLMYIQENNPFHKRFISISLSPFEALLLSHSFSVFSAAFLTLRSLLANLRANFTSEDAIFTHVISRGRACALV